MLIKNLTPRSAGHPVDNSEDILFYVLLSDNRYSLEEVPPPSAHLPAEREAWHYGGSL